jgi:hypothetical protein
LRDQYQVQVTNAANDNEIAEINKLFQKKFAPCLRYLARLDAYLNLLYSETIQSGNDNLQLEMYDELLRSKAARKKAASFDIYIDGKKIVPHEVDYSLMQKICEAAQRALDHFVDNEWMSDSVGAVNIEARIENGQVQVNLREASLQEMDNFISQREAALAELQALESRKVEQLKTNIASRNGAINAVRQRFNQINPTALPALYRYFQQNQNPSAITINNPQIQIFLSSINDPNLRTEAFALIQKYANLIFFQRWDIRLLERHEEHQKSLKLMKLLPAQNPATQPQSSLSSNSASRVFSYGFDQWGNFVVPEQSPQRVPLDTLADNVNIYLRGNCIASRDPRMF